jgi:hypothetical protein
LGEERRQRGMEKGQRRMAGKGKPMPAAEHACYKPTETSLPACPGKTSESTRLLNAVSLR